MSKEIKTSSKGLPFKTILALFFNDATAWRFALGVALGLGFSIAVILSTIGIMDGFERGLKSALRKGHGDLIILPRYQFFNDEDVMKATQEAGLSVDSIGLQLEGFATFQGHSRAIQIRAANQETLKDIAGVDLHYLDSDIVIGQELATQLQVKVGDELALVLAQNNKTPSGLPGINHLRVGAIVNHGLYLKDLRQAYLSPKALRNLSSIKDGKSNWASANTQSGQDLEQARIKLAMSLGPDYLVRTFWFEFSTLLEAVKVEKLIIGLILQLVVIMASFNVVAFAGHLNEKKAKELFLLKALGLSTHGLRKLWLSITFLLWLGACALSILMVAIMNWSLINLSIFKLPAEVYNLTRLQLVLRPSDYLLVFLSSGIWTLVVSFPGLRRLSKAPILGALRKEFS